MSKKIILIKMNEKNELAIAATAVFLILAAATTVLTIPPTAEAQQQPPSTPAGTTITTTIGGNVSAAAQQIIETISAECAQIIEVPPELQSGTEELGIDIKATLVADCLSLVYESDRRVVLSGGLLVDTGSGLYSDNPFLWQAVDEFEVLGYTVESIITGGQGSEGNPHTLYVVMSKQQPS